MTQDVMQILISGSDPKIYLSERSDRLPNTSCYSEPCHLILILSLASARYTSMTNEWIDHATVTFVSIITIIAVMPPNKTTGYCTYNCTNTTFL